MSEEKVKDLLFGDERVSLRKYTGVLALIVQDTCKEQGISEDASVRCVVAAINLLHYHTEDGVQTILNLHQRI